MQDKKTFKKLAYSYAAYSGASVLGPMLILGGIGYVLDKLLGTRFIVFAGVGVAFIVTNILIYKKTQKLSETIGKMEAPLSATQEQRDADSHVSEEKGSTEKDIVKQEGKQTN